MKKEFSSSVSWNSAALAGLVMGVFTIAVDYLPSLPLLLGGTGVFVGILNFILKVVKIVACVIAFKYLLERFHNNVKVGYPGTPALWTENSFVFFDSGVRIHHAAASCNKPRHDSADGEKHSGSLSRHDGFKHGHSHGKDDEYDSRVHVCLHIALLLPLGMDALNRIRQKTVPCQRFRRAHSG